MSRSGSLPEALRLVIAVMDRSVARRLALTLALVAVGGLLAGAAPLALKHLVDALSTVSTERATAGPVLAFGALYLLALCGSRLVIEIRPLVANTAEQRIHARLRQRFFSHLLSLRLSFHLSHRTGAVIHSLQQALTGYQLVIVHVVNSVVPVLVEILTAVVVLAQLRQPALTATFTVTAIAYVAIFSIGTARLRERARAVTDASLNAHATIADSLVNIETIKCFNAEPILHRRLAKESDAIEAHWLALHQQRTRIGLTLTAIFMVSTIVSVAVAVQAVAAGTLTIGGFVLANVYMLQIVRPLETMGLAVRDLSQAMSFIRPLLELLHEPTETQLPAPGCGHSEDVPRGAMRHRPAPSIRFQHVHFRYGAAKPVLEDIDLEIRAGSSVAVVGASGCGKSSLVRLLLRLHEPSAGCIRLDDMPIDTLPLAELRRRIGLVPQDVALFNDTIEANIRIGLAAASRDDIVQASRTANLHDFIASLPAGYDTPVGERGLMLSGGERQRIAIARAVLKRPLVYVFDEATSMLDSRTEVAILDELRHAAAGCTTVMIAHRLSTVRHADDILVLEAGGIAERGTHVELLARNGPYSRLWRAQLRADA